MSNYVEVKKTGDGRVAVFERATNEPVQYVVSKSPETLMAEWEETLSSRAARMAKDRLER